MKPFTQLQNLGGRTILICGSFLLVACMLILLTATTYTTTLRASQIIGRNWHPAYDMVVLPPQAKLLPGNIQPPDYLEGYGGGISFQQYEQIKTLPGVEVAAPLSFLGYVRLPTPAVSFSSTILPPGYYRVDWTLTAFNGQRWLVEKQETRIFDIVPSCHNIASGGVLQTLTHQGLLFSCGADAQPVFPSIDTGTFLLAAVDPQAENQLTSLNSALTSGRMLNEQDDLHINPAHPSTPIGEGGSGGQTHIVNVPNQEIPVLVETQLPGHITLHAVFSRVASSDLTLEQVQARGGLAYLQRLPVGTPLFQGDVPLVQNDPQRFSQAELVWNGKIWQVKGYQNASGSGLTFLYIPSGLTYRATQSPGGQNEPAYVVLPTGSEGPEAVFRSLQPSPIGKSDQFPFIKAIYQIEPLGSIAGSRLDTQFANSLNWLPETTYAEPSVITRENAAGSPVPATTLVPTTNTAGFILQPPLALTTVKVAEKLLGANAISAIRLRVAGITQASPENWQKIQQLAQLIEQHTGLHVFVTIGSSPQPVLVNIPGWGQQIASEGWVEERWIYSGAAVVYLNQVGLLRNILLAVVVLICLGYQIATFSSLAAARRNEFAVLSALGWRPWQPIIRFLRQFLILALVGGIAGMLLALLTASLLRVEILWTVFWWTLPVIMVIGFLSTLYSLQQIWRIRPAEVLRTGSRITPDAHTKKPGFFKRFLPPMFAFSLRSLLRSRVRTTMVFLVLFLVSFLLGIVFSGLFNLH